MGAFPPIKLPLVEVNKAPPEDPNLIIRGDIRSANWDGAGDIPAFDTTATEGYLIDYSTGNAQFNNVFTTTITITDSTLEGDVTLTPDTLFTGGTLTVEYGPTNALGVTNTTDLTVTGGDDKEIATFSNDVATSGETLSLVVKTARVAGGGTDAATADLNLFRTVDSVVESGITFADDRVSITGGMLTLPVKATTGDPSSPADGDMYVNTFDNKVRVYADAAWRDLATW